MFQSVVSTIHFGFLTCVISRQICRAFGIKLLFFSNFDPLFPDKANDCRHFSEKRKNEALAHTHKEVCPQREDSARNLFASFGSALFDERQYKSLVD